LLDDCAVALVLNLYALSTQFILVRHQPKYRKIDSTCCDWTAAMRGQGFLYMNGWAKGLLFFARYLRTAQLIADALSEKDFRIGLQVFFGIQFRFDNTLNLLSPYRHSEFIDLGI